MNRIALVQMQSLADIKHNLSVVKALLEQACENKCKLVLLPENFAFMGKQDHDKLNVAEEYGYGPIQESISSWAKKYQLWVIAGTIPLKSSLNKVTASCLVFDDMGNAVERYDKIHLFDVAVTATETYQESAYIQAGNKPAVVSTPVGKIGLSICYDIRFAELYRTLSAQGAEIFTVPSAFTAATGKAHWEVLVRNRAIENLAFVLAANQTGEHANHRKTYGHSMVVDPWGRVLAQKDSGEGLIVADIDLQVMYDLRKSFPCMNHHVLI